MIFYFSGTGNSRYCAKWLAHRLGDEAVDAFPFLRDDHFPHLPVTVGLCVSHLRLAAPPYF